MTTHRFPPPWTVEDIGAAFVVTYSAEQKLAYVYFEDEPGRRSAARLLSKDEAQRIAIRKLLLLQVLMLANGGHTLRSRLQKCSISSSPTTSNTG